MAERILNTVYGYLLLDAALRVVLKTGKLLITGYVKLTICHTHLKY